MNFFLLKQYENIDRTLVKERINAHKETKRTTNIYTKFSE